MARSASSRPGFVWSVIEKKWPGFEAAFLGFEPKRLLFQPDEFWEGLAGDTRIVRNPQKITAVRDNARFVADIAREHGSFGKFLERVARRRSDRPARAARQARRAARRRAPASISCASSARTCFVTSPDVVACLRDAGLDIAESPTSKKDLQEDPGPVQRLGRGDRPAATPTSRASAPCRSARTTTPRPCAAAAAARSSGRTRSRPLRGCPHTRPWRADVMLAL